MGTHAAGRVRKIQSTRGHNVEVIIKRVHARAHTPEITAPQLVKHIHTRVFDYRRTFRKLMAREKYRVAFTPRLPFQMN